MPDPQETALNALNATASGRSRAVPAPATARPGRVPEGARPSVRLCFLGARVVESAGGGIDWPATAAERERLSKNGCGVAEVMDARLRLRLGWEDMAELVRHTGAQRLANGFVAGADVDHLTGAPTVEELVAGIAFQASAIEEAGGVPVLLPITALARRRATESEYVEVYRSILERVNGPVLIAWIGPRVRAELAGYFPGKSFARVMEIDPAKVRGALLELADVTLEGRTRRELLARGQIPFTGLGPHVAELVLGGNPAVPPSTPPVAERQVELAGRAVALGDFSHLIADGLDGRETALHAALERLESGDARAYLEHMQTLGESAPA